MSELGSVYDMGVNIGEANEPIPLPAGEYRGTVQGAELKTSKSGNPMLVLTHIVSPEQYPADYQDGNPDGEKLTTHHMLTKTPRNLWQLRKLHEMYGVPPSHAVDATQFIGQDVILLVTHEDYQGAAQARANPVRAA